MFRFFGFCALFAAVALGDVSFKAKVKTFADPTMPNALLTGTINYFYNTTLGAINHNIRIDWDAPYNMAEQWVFSRAIHYRRCGTTCTAETYKQAADRYFKLPDDQLVPGATWNGCNEYTRLSGNVKQIWVHPTTQAVCKVALNGQTGQRTIEFSNVGAVDNAALQAYTTWGCPAPVCNRVMDLALVLDESGSINETEWKSLIKFAKDLIARHTVSASAVAVGVIFFDDDARVRTWMTVNQNNINNALNTNPGEGWTCIGCGVTVAVENMFATSKRITGRAANPAKLMVVLTDGENNRPNTKGATPTGNLTAAGVLAKNAGISVLAIGVDGYRETDLRLIASNTATGYMILGVSQFNDLGPLLDRIVAQTCTDLPPMPCGLTCFGFCSCNKVCSCPQCLPNTPCATYDCTMNRDGSTSGCVKTPVTCTAPNKCKIAWCDETQGCMVKDKDCSDGDPCTQDLCDGNGNCYQTPVDCDDHKVCTVDSCDATGTCQHVVSCDDSNDCTIDQCGDDGQCERVPVDCDDGDKCTQDSCAKVGGCRSTPTICDDGDKCTEDFCDSVVGCYHTPADCDDSDLCTKDSCVVDCIHEPQPCDACKMLLEVQNCTTDNLCMVSECVEINNVAQCVTVPKPKACPKESPCNLVTQCDPTTGDCTYQEVVCDPIPCYTSTCNPTTGKCDYVPLDCTEEDPCFTGYCDNMTGTCKRRPNCTTTEKCKVAVCVKVGGEAQCQTEDYSCDSGNACLIDSCNLETGECNLPVDKVCDDGLFCTVDSCDKELGCVTTPLSCDDGDPCTDDFCSEDTECTHTPRCDDGLYCTDDWCNSHTGECVHSDIVCNLKFTQEERNCFEEVCNEDKHRCEKQVRPDAVLTVCGDCLDVFSNWSLFNDTTARTACVGKLEWPKFAAALSAGVIAGIIIAAIVAAIIVAAGSFFGARELIRQAKSAQDQAAVNNPLYQQSGAEMENPGFIGDT